jgi:hypothetical protein
MCSVLSFMCIVFYCLSACSMTTFFRDMLCSWIAKPLVEGDQLLFMVIKITLPCTDDTISVYDGKV